MKAREWYRIQMAADEPTAAEIHIIDVIGSWDDDWIARNFGYDMGITARAFVEALSQLPDSVKSLRVHINSPGGDVFAAANIANALRDQRTSKGRTVDVFVDGIAASAASVVMMAGDTIRVSDNGLVMVHNPYTIALGNAAEMRKIADVLDTLRQTIIATYQWHSTLTSDELAALMDAETWMDADQALANGFATEKVAGLKAAASLDRRSVASLKVPDRFRARVDALLAPKEDVPQPLAALEVVRVCREADCLELVEDLIVSGATRVVVESRVTAAKARKDAEQTRQREIRALCEQAKQKDLADDYIAGGMTVGAVRAQLAKVTAKVDAIEIDGSLGPDQGKGKPRIDAGAIYARINAPAVAQ